MTTEIRQELPIDRKIVLTPNEAAEYASIGLKKIQELTNQPDCPFVLKNGNRRLIKREEFEAYIREHQEI